MDNDSLISPPCNEEDTEGAIHVFEGFEVIYKPALLDIDHYLEDMMVKMGEDYAQAYQPWHAALQGVIRGVYLTSRNIPLKDPDEFLDAVMLLSFDSAVRFLYDIYVNCRSSVPRRWMAEFNRHIHLLLVAAAILYNRREPSLAR